MPTVPSRLTLLLLACLTSYVGLVMSASAQEATPEVEVDGVTVLPPDASYGGATRGEWDARYWQWMVSLPESVNPFFDPSSDRCGYGQFGPVFLLPGNFTDESATAICVVPEGTAIFVVVGGAECSTVEPSPFFGRNEPELRACAAAMGPESITDIEASINGEPVPNLEEYRSSSPLFALTFAEDNFFGVPPGVALSVSDSYNFIITPPPPGEYEVAVSVTFSDGFTIASATRVIVEAAQVIEPGATPEPGTPIATPAS